jgi:hypothetical protein
MVQAWRAEMNAALGVARATNDENQYNSAIAQAKGLANQHGTSQTQQAVIAHMGRTFPQDQVFVDYGPQVFSGGGGGSGGSPPPRPAPPPPPPPPPRPTTFSVKQPSPSLVQYDPDVLPQELLTDLLYEDVGGQELISISRHDTIDGQNVSYALIRNLSILNQSFNPNNILAGQITYSNQLGQYALDIANKITSSGNPAYLDENGNLVIELLSASDDEYLEVQISSNGTIYTG